MCGSTPRSRPHVHSCARGCPHCHADSIAFAATSIRPPRSARANRMDATMPLPAWVLALKSWSPFSPRGIGSSHCAFLHHPSVYMTVSHLLLTFRQPRHNNILSLKKEILSQLLIHQWDSRPLTRWDAMGGHHAVTRLRSPSVITGDELTNHSRGF